MPAHKFDAAVQALIAAMPDTFFTADRLEQQPLEDLPEELDQQWIHAGWRRQRQQVFEALHRTQQPASRINGFATCGSQAWLMRSTTNPNCWKIAGSRCHDRFCQRCAKTRAVSIAYNVIDYLRGKQARFLTLTIRSSGDGLAAMIAHLTDSFRKLRRRRFWRKHVTGGVAFLEVKWSETSGTWHPHFHILITGRYLDWQRLRQEWYKVTGDSHVIDIRAIKSEEHAYRYVTKYASKPLNNTFSGREALLDEAIVALRGKKLAHTFGDCRGLILVEKPEETGWTNEGSLGEWIARARRGDAEAIDVLTQLSVADYCQALLSPDLLDVPPPPQLPTPPKPQPRLWS